MSQISAREISQNWVCGLKKLVENEAMTQQPKPGTGGTLLKPLLDAQHPLVVFTEQMDWDTLCTTFETSYQDEGRPSVPVRVLVGLHYLKTLNNESDESVVTLWVENPYWPVIWHGNTCVDTIHFSTSCHVIRTT